MDSGIIDLGKLLKMNILISSGAKGAGVYYVLK
jgi:ribosome-associated protein YbcJ (S4-like RNA binding protein)